MNFSDLEKYISAERLSTYSTLVGCTDLDKTIGAYYWNKALGGTVYTFLQCLEVTLRNSLHVESWAKIGKETWYETVCKVVGNRARAKQTKAGKKRKYTVNETKIYNTIEKLKREGKVVSSANVISSLTLGFWVNLFQGDYASSTQTLLWPELLPKVFPNAPKGISLATCFSELKDINLLRNRFSHHEPLWKSGSVLTIDDAIAFLDSEVEKIFRYVGHINSDREKMLRQSAAFKEFKILNTRQTFDLFIGNGNKSLTAQQFKADLNLYLKQVCVEQQVIYVKRNNALARISCY
ncbi:Abi family protein [Geotalea sp. SG265]|uniref:Abi family protein n=1 Tax=Geotalea sp. SG265 TaxID=2922867 RepID=UPI001FB0294E|nr:Abi family protein [Geotalea sp. SG265]